MQLQTFLVPLGCAALLFLAHRSLGWPGVAAASGGIVMWLLLHITRLMSVMQRAAKRPIGHVDSAVMLNAKLKTGVTLMHVIAMTRSLGERVSTEGTEPEVLRWTDAGHSTVDAAFMGGKLVRWQLTRPEPEAPTPAPAQTPDPASTAP